MEKMNTLDYAKFSPVLVKSVDDLKNTQVISSKILSKDLGIVNTSNGLNAPQWFINVVENDIDTIVIDGIDKINFYEQEKFYELLKYKTISSVDFGKDIKIYVVYTDIEKVSKTIKSLCLVM